MKVVSFGIILLEDGQQKDVVLLRDPILQFANVII